MVRIQPLLQEVPTGKRNSTYRIHRVTSPSYKEVIKIVRTIATIKK